MTLSTSYKKTDELYKEHLKTIRSLKFTFREIDILACIVHNRGEKKIASMLSISPRTVSVHVYNAMNKIGCNTKDQVIDFIEASGKLTILREYYLHLLLKSHFEKQLTHIANRINRSETTCYCYRTDVLSLDNSLYQSIQKHLNLVHIKLVEIGPDENNSPIFEVRNIREAGYYHDLLTHLLEVISPPQKDQILKEFDDAYQTIINIHEGKTAAVEDNGNGNNKNKIFNYIKNVFETKSIYALIVMSIALISLGVFFFFDRGTGEFKSLYAKQLEVPIRSDLSLPSESTLLSRSDVIGVIDDKFNQTTRAIQTLALVGIGGSGKTTLARQYGRQQKANVVWEINAETNTSLLESFENLAYELSTTPEDKRIFRELTEIKSPSLREKKIVDFVKSRLKRHTNWFLIYDNVENFADIQKHFPLNSEIWGRGKILITTRDSTIQNNRQIDHAIFVGELDKVQKLNLFSQIMRNGENEQLTPQQSDEMISFLEKIPPFPLDVYVAAYYLKTTNISYADYLEQLNKLDKNFTSVQESLLKGAGEYTKTRNGIIILSVEKVMNINKYFADLLLLISLLDSQQIPRELLDHYKDKVVVDNFKVIVDDFIFQLKKYSLITVKSNSSSIESAFSIHRSTQEIILAYLTRELKLKENNYLIQSVSHTFGSYVQDALDKDDLLRGAQLVTHLEKLLKHDTLLSEPIRASLNVKLAYIYFFSGDYQKTKNILEKSYETLKKYYNEEDIRFGPVLFYLSMVDRELGNYEKVQPNLEKSLNIYQKSFKKDYQKIADIIELLGVTYRDLGQYDTAKHCFQESRKIYEKHCSKNQIRLAWITAQSGILEGKLGHYRDAQRLLEQSFKSYKNHFGEKHPETVWSLVNLGISYKRLGEYERAKACFEKGLLVYNKFYSKGHFNVAWILTHLGEVYGYLGNYQHAKDLHEQSVLIFKKNFPDTHQHHINVAWARVHLGTSHKNLNNLKEAKLCLESSLQIYEKHYGKNHIETTDILLSLGQVYLLEKNLEMAEKFILKALDISKENSHPSMYKCLESYSDLHLKKIEDSKLKNSVQEEQHLNLQARKALEQALEVVKAHFPENSPHIKRIQEKIKKL